MRMRASNTKVNNVDLVGGLKTKKMAESNSPPADASAPDYLKIIADHREELLTAMKATDWVATKNKNGIAVAYRMTEKGKMFRAEFEIDASPKVGVRYCSPGPNNGIREKFQKKSAFKSVEIIEEKENYFIARELIASAMMGLIAERDMICLYGWDTESDDGTYILHPGIEHPKYPPQDKPVRATKSAGGHFFYPVEGNPDKSRVVAIFVLNMGGMLPVSVVDSFQTGALFNFATEWKTATAKKFHESN